MCKRVYYICGHHPYVKECAAKYEEPSCCFGGGEVCRGIAANETTPRPCPDCAAKQAATRAANKNGWYGHSHSASRGANRLKNQASCDSVIEPNLMQGVTAMPGIGTYDSRRRQPPPVQPAYYPQGRRAGGAPPRQPARNMPSIHEASHRPQVQRGYVAAQPMSATVVYPTPPSYHHKSQRRQQPPPMSSVQRHEPPSFSRHMRQHTTTGTASPARQMSRRPGAPQRAPQQFRKPIRRDSNGVSECGSDDEDDRRYPSTSSPLQATFHVR
ncbi:hypothetical protein PG988_008795 [Apiospora saccharicola]